PLDRKRVWRLPPSTRGADPTTIEIVVDAHGMVESVRAIDPQEDLSKSLMVTLSPSTAKSSRFLPARKDGRAVRHRPLFTVTLQTEWIESRSSRRNPS